MADPRIEKWARALTGYSVEVQPGQTVAIVGQPAAEPLLLAVHREVVRRGAYPVLLSTPEGALADLLREASDEQLQFISPIDRFVRAEADVVINIRAETNTRRMSDVDPQRQSRYSAARRGLFETYMERAADGRLDWTLTLFPTDAYAQDADMDTEAYTDFVLSACKLTGKTLSPPGWN
jgi:aminopeptidase